MTYLPEYADPTIFTVDGNIIGCGSTPNKTCYQYNTLNDSWTFLSTSTTTHVRQPGVAYNGKLYIYDNFLPETFEPSTKVWSTWPAPPERLSFDPCMIAWRDSFLVFGNSQDSVGVQKFNHTTQSWQILGTNGVRIPFYSSVCVLMPDGENVLIVGSSDALYSKSVQLYKITENYFYQLPDAPRNMYGSALARFGSRILAFGGLNENYKVVYELISNNTWILLPTPLLQSHSFHDVVVLPSSMFNFAGAPCSGFD